MNKIFCFSGTGNSLYAANKIAETLDADVCNMREPVECGSDVIGFVFPTYFWGLPKTVSRFLEKMRITNKNAYIFSVTTYGSFSYGVSGAVNKLLGKQGVKLSYGGKVKMVENYIPGFNANDTDKLWEKSDKKIDRIIADIAGRRRNTSEIYTVFNNAAQKFYPANNGNCAKNFTVDGCKACGLCEKICPNDNITFIDGAPQFGESCELCMGCLNVCPADAINYGTATGGKKRYKNRKVSANELIDLYHPKK